MSAQKVPDGGAKCSFSIDAHLYLAACRERAPIINAYLTSDVRPEGPDSVACSDSYRLRISRGRSMKTRWRDVAKEDRCDTQSRVSFDAQLELKPLGELRKYAVAPDAALCLQAFCEVSCASESEWGLHTCGWTCVRLSSLAEANASLSVPFCDQGRSQPGARGFAEIAVTAGRFVLMQLLEWQRSSLPLFEQAPEYPILPINISDLRSGLIFPNRDLQAYGADVFKSVDDEPRVAVRGIRMRRQPHYAACGRCVVRPSCAFLLVEEPPPLSEDYYVAALKMALDRRFRAASAARRAEADALFLAGEMNGNDAGGILMDVAMLAPTACTYLFDEVLDANGENLVPGEDFSRLLSIMFTNDCEDYSFFAVMVLWDILRRDWKSPGARALQRVRMHYVATLVLKAVTRPSLSYADESPATAKQDKGLAAHNCCDLVPIEALLRTLPTDAAPERAVLTEMVATRKARCRPLRHPPTYVVIGEGTVRLVQFTSASDWNPACTSTHVRETVAAIFASDNVGFSTAVSAPVVEEMAPSGRSSFFRAAVTSIVHDTLMARSGSAWPLCYIKWISVGTGQRGLGVPHDVYLTMDPSLIRTEPFGEPSSRLLYTMRMLERFEHPLVPLAAPGISDSSIFAERSQLVQQMVDRVNAALETAVGLTMRISAANDLTEVYLPLWSLDSVAIAALERRLLSAGNRRHPLAHVAVVFERIADALVSVVFNLRFLS